MREMTMMLVLAGLLSGCAQGDTLMERLTGDPPTCEGERKRAMNRGNWDFAGRGFAALAGPHVSCG